MWNVCSHVWSRYPSGYISDGDCVGLENAGFLSVVNEWLLQSHEGAIRVFETVPPGQAVSFHRLAAQDGFLVSASIDAIGHMRNFTVFLPRPASGRHVLLPTVCRCFVPTRWQGGRLEVVDSHTGAAIPYSGSAPAQDSHVISFKVQAGHQYTVLYRLAHQMW
jgi:hypothetical protein